MYHEHDVSFHPFPLFPLFFALFFVFVFFSATPSPQHGFFGHPILMFFSLAVLFCLASIGFRIQNNIQVQEHMM